jgi:holo-[acyl-carrier protein] synthase
MPIVGIGTDIIEVSRIADMSIETRERLAKRILTPNEYQYLCKLNTNSESVAIRYLAKRWAGKEAAAKALGTGIAKGVSFQHIEIKTLESGQPILVLSDVALSIARSKNANFWHISLADEKFYATAFVTLS